MFAFLLGLAVHAQTIGTFQSVQPMAQTELFVIPQTHRFQVLIQTGDSLMDGTTMPTRPDFTGYVPIGGSSTQGRLGVNSEDFPGGVTAFEVQYNTVTELWEVTASGRCDLSVFADSAVLPTARNCSGGVTPWGTIITCEEQESAADLDSNGYNDLGWSIEIDLATRRAVDQDGDSIPDKLWAMGAFRHENAVVRSDSAVVYQGEDNFAHGFLFKFVLDQKAKLGSGKLYVLRQNGTLGDWILIPNTTQWERNHTTLLADSLGGTHFMRIEDVEIGPEGKIYFASTAQGRIFRFRDHGLHVSHFETFVDFQAFPIHHRLGTTPWLFHSPDNLAFDGEGNLWVMQDGGQSPIWVIGPDHTSAQPDARIFANTPLYSEPTGITFSPDHRFLFMSIQHPYANNSIPVVDAAGNTIVFNRDATLVIARAEDLGTPQPLGVPDPRTHMEAFPNPAHEAIRFTLESPAEGQAQVTVVEILGRVTLRTQRTLVAGHNEILLDISALPCGSYVAIVEGAAGRWMRSFTKE